MWNWILIKAGLSLNVDINLSENFNIVGKELQVLDFLKIDVISKLLNISNLNKSNMWNLSLYIKLSKKKNLNIVRKELNALDFLEIDASSKLLNISNLNKFQICEIEFWSKLV